MLDKPLPLLNILKRQTFHLKVENGKAQRPFSSKHVAYFRSRHVAKKTFLSSSCSTIRPTYIEL